MKRFTKVVISVILLLSMPFVLTGCYRYGDDYQGEYPDLYSVAIHSIAGTSGFYFSEVKADSRINLLENDSNGRTLFSYYENTIISTYSLVISQKTENGYVYFYPDYNFISSSADVFSEEQIEQLKEKNDWNKEMNEDKCAKVEIIRNKSKGPISEKDIAELYDLALGDDAYLSKYSVDFIITDLYGRALYTGTGKTSSNRAVVMLFNPDGSHNGSTSVMELKNYYSYQEELKAFKERNHWNQPLS